MRIPSWDNFSSRGIVFLNHEYFRERVQAHQIASGIRGFCGERGSRANRLFRAAELIELALSLGQLQTEPDALGGRQAVQIRFGYRQGQIVFRLFVLARGQETLSFGAVPVPVHRPRLETRRPHGRPRNRFKEGHNLPDV